MCQVPALVVDVSLLHCLIHELVGAAASQAPMSGLLLHITCSGRVALNAELMLEEEERLAKVQRSQNTRGQESMSAGRSVAYEKRCHFDVGMGKG
jgi:hypothetical protein